MKKIVIYKKQFSEDEEEDKSIKAIKDLIDMENVDTSEERGKMMAIIQGLVHADTKVGDKFLSQINDFTSTLKIEDFKESCKKGKGTKKKT